VGITVGDGVVTVTLRARADTEREAQRILDRHVQEVRDRFGDVVYGSGGETLAAALARVMGEHGVTVGVAESLTGGLIGHMLVEVPGISSFFLADVVAYSNEAKENLLGVPHETLVAHGAVSEPVARAMAEGARRAAGSDLGISTTGIAGPTGGTEEKPVGLVYVGVALEGSTAVTKLNVRGDRARVKDRTAKYALNQARLALQRGLDCMEEERVL
jgi:nicotinamide-nucleotide amidase